MLQTQSSLSSSSPPCLTPFFVIVFFIFVLYLPIHPFHASRSILVTPDLSLGHCSSFLIFLYLDIPVETYHCLSLECWNQEGMNNEENRWGNAGGRKCSVISICWDKRVRGESEQFLFISSRSRGGMNHLCWSLRRDLTLLHSARQPIDVLQTLAK